MITKSSHCGRYERFANRREFLKKAGAGFGLLAFADLLQPNQLFAEAPARATNPMAPLEPHYGAKAKSIIWLFMEGAPSSVDLFDPKPELTKSDGKKIEIDVFNGNPGPLMKSPFSFKQYGQSGAWVCEKYPNVAKHVDDFAFIKSLYSESNDHAGALSNQYRDCPAGISQRWLVDHLWAGQRKSESPRLCGARQQPGCKGWAAELERGLPPHELPGNTFSFFRRAHLEPDQAGARDPGRSTRPIGFPEQGQPRTSQTA